jgi:predicted  nucleic acid-binding Zn-ribbon protein
MNELLKNLVKLQELELADATDAKQKALIEELRGKIPPQVLGHYDRLMVRGKKGIVPVRGQACSGCHMRLPIGVVSTLMKAADIQLCDSCGRYLFLPEGEGTQVLVEAAEAKVETQAKRKRAAKKRA